MDFGFDDTTTDLRRRLEEFYEAYILPAEPVFAEQIESQDSPWDTPPIMEELKAKARAEGLWNLFLPDARARRRPDQPRIRAAVRGHGPQPVPGSRGVQLLGARHRQHGTAGRVRHPRAEGPLAGSSARRARSAPAFSMTEPRRGLLRRHQHRAPASPATATTTSSRPQVVHLRRDVDPAASCCIVMGVTDPEAERHRRHSMMLVPLDTPGVDIRRSMHVFGYLDGPQAATPSRLSTTSVSRRPTCSATRARASRSPRRGSVPAGSTTHARDRHGRARAAS